MLGGTPKGVVLNQLIRGKEYSFFHSYYTSRHLQVEARRREGGGKKGKRWAQGQVIFGGAPSPTADAITGRALDFASFPSWIPASLFLSFALPSLLPQTRQFCFVVPSTLSFLAPEGWNVSILGSSSLPIQVNFWLLIGLPEEKTAGELKGCGGPLSWVPSRLFRYGRCLRRRRLVQFRAWLRCLREAEWKGKSCALLLWGVP